MTFVLRAFQVLAVVATISFQPATVAAQAGARPQDHDHAVSVGPRTADTGSEARVMEQMAALDTRIEALATEMRMLSGEPKIEAMAALLTTLLERHALMERRMGTMRNGMMRDGMMRDGMMRRGAAPAGRPAVSADIEPGSMCAPVD